MSTVVWAVSELFGCWPAHTTPHIWLPRRAGWRLVSCHGTNCGGDEFCRYCLVLDKVVAVTSTSHTKSRDSCDAENHRLSFGGAIIAA